MIALSNKKEVEYVEPSSPVEVKPEDEEEINVEDSEDESDGRDTNPGLLCPTSVSAASLFQPFNLQTSLSTNPFLTSAFTSLGGQVSASSSSRLPQLPNIHQPQANMLNAKNPNPFSIENILKPNFVGDQQNLFLQAMMAAAASRAAAAMASAAPSTAFGLLPSAKPSDLLPPPPVQRPQPQKVNSGQLSPPTLAIRRPEPSSTPPATKVGEKRKHSSSSGDSNGSSENSKDSSTPKADGDCPPGMVRGPNGQLWPAWVFCTRYSDRPSSGPRLRKVKKKGGDGLEGGAEQLAGGGGGLDSSFAAASKKVDPNAEKRPRTAFTSEQLNRLRKEFEDNRYLNEDRRKHLSSSLGLNETQIKIWFQNKRAKLKKTTGDKSELRKMLAAQGLYNHSTVAVDEDEYPDL